MVSKCCVRGCRNESFPQCGFSFYRQQNAMTPEETLAGLLIACWGWRLWSLFYSSYSIAEAVTFKSASVTPRAVVTGALMATSLVCHMVPTTQFPLLSLTNKLLSIPSEIYTLYFAHIYLSPTLNSRRFTAVLYFFTLLSVIATFYSIYIDIDKLL